MNKHTHCDHDHHHSHGGPNLLIAYFIGLGLYIIALLLGDGMVSDILYLGALGLSGFHIIIEGIQDTITKTKKQKRFISNIHVLMTLAALGAIIIGDFHEAALLILIFAGAHFLEGYAENRSKKEITNLMNLTPAHARLIQEDGSTKLVDVSTLKIGDKLQVLAGDQIPTDGTIEVGFATINQATITGESIPVDKGVGDGVFGATINGHTPFTMIVTKDSSETVFAKIVTVVSQAQNNLSSIASFIKRVEPKYVNGVLIAAPLFYLLGLTVFNWTHDVSFYRSMVFLIVASPCALAATDIPASLSAISNLARHGVLFKSSAALSNLADIKGVAFDKTGTLTEGKPVVTNLYFNPSLSQAEADKLLSIIVNMERQSNHPLAEAITDHFNPPHIAINTTSSIGTGLSARIDNRLYEVAKPSVFTNISAEILSQTSQFEHEGKTVVYMAVDKTVLGLIALQDIPKADTKEAIDTLKQENIHTVMLTGDAEKTGQAIAQSLNIDTVYTNILPEAKLSIIKALQEQHGMIAMIGDGINDAPALVQADIGIAMGQGTDIAIDAADGVLVNNSLTRFTYTHKLAKKLRKVVIQNIIFAMTVVCFLIIMNILGFMDMWLAVTIHEGSTVLVLLNGLRLLRSIE